MNQAQKYSLTYHNHPKYQSEKKGRNVESRLKLIRREVSFKDRTVLDLGCSGGLFSFLLAEEAKKIIAIDSDSDVILRNEKIQRELEIDNIEFKINKITPQFLNGIEEKVDVVLFLSVFHHMITNSTVYHDNQKSEFFDYQSLFDTIAQKAELLVFEMGKPDEGYLWCPDLPKYSGSWNEFVKEKFLKPHFNTVKSLSVSPQYISLVNRMIRKTRKEYKKDGFIRQKIKSFAGYDPRDYRELFFCSNKI